MKGKVLFYAKNLENIKIQQFYQIDFRIIRENGYELVVTDKWIELLKVWKYDILFLYFYTWSFARGLAFYLTGKKIFLTGGIDALNRETTNSKEFKKQKMLFWLCYHIATKCIIVSDTDWNNIIEEFSGKLVKKLVKSYHTIDSERFKSDINSKENIFVSICWQGSDGNVLRKGIDKSLILFKYISAQKEFSDYKYYIIGKPGPGTPFLKKMISDSELDDKVILTGAVSEDDKVAFLKKAKYYFQLSFYEGFGLAALEAEAANDIILHSGKGGLKYVVGDNGILVDRDNIDSECQRVYNELIHFDNGKLEKALTRVNTEFKYETRKEQFAHIFSC